MHEKIKDTPTQYQDLSQYEGKILSTEAVRCEGSLPGDVFERNIEQAIENHYDIYRGDFYVVCMVVNKKAELYSADEKRQIVMKYFARQTCPTPHYGEYVYKFHRKSSTVKLLWALPDLHEGERLLRYGDKDDPALRSLFEFMEAFKRGDLHKLCLKENGEDV